MIIHDTRDNSRYQCSMSAKCYVDAFRSADRNFLIYPCKNCYKSPLISPLVYLFQHCLSPQHPCCQRFLTVLSLFIGRNLYAQYLYSSYHFQLPCLYSAAMKEQKVKTPASGSSLIRYHSPHCESTGPIVQEGFVAARIRVFQGLQNQPSGEGHSHSPMTPCPPIPPWLQIYEHRTPSKPALISRVSISPSDPTKSQTSKGCHKAVLAREHQTLSSGESTAVESPNRAPFHKCNILRDASRPSTVCIQPDQQRSDACSTAEDCVKQDTEPEILSPRAIPADMAEPSDAWPLPQANGGQVNEQPTQLLRTRRSIADKLGSMVDRGWVGCDVFGKTYNDQEAVEATPPTFHVREKRVVYRSQSLGEEHHARDRSIRGSLHPSVLFRAYEEPRRAVVDDGSVFDGREPKSIWYHGSRNSRQRKSNAGGTTARRRSNSHMGESDPDENSTPALRKKRRAWTLHHPDRAERSQSQYIKLRTMSSSQGLANHHSEQGVPASSVFKSPKSIWNPPGEAVQDRHPSSASSNAPRSRLSSATTEQSKKSSNGSLSWYKKLAWYKLVLVDKRLVLQDLSERRSERRAENTTSVRAQQDGRFIRLRRVSTERSKTHTLAECGHKDETEICRPKVTEQLLDIKKQREPRLRHTTPLRKNLASSAITVGTTDARLSPIPQFSSTRGPPLSECPQPNTPAAGVATVSADLESQYDFDESRRSEHVQTPKRSTTPTLHARSASGAGPFLSHPSGAFMDSVRGPPNQKSSPEERSSSGSLQTPASSPRGRVRSESSPESVRFESKDKGNGIKRVQVIVSLDGADDLLIVAKIQRRGQNHR